VCLKLDSNAFDDIEDLQAIGQFIDKIIILIIFDANLSSLVNVGPR